MATTKRIVCLANSRKLSGRCVAGKERVGTTVGGWVRPVSGREHEEVSEHERQYPDGSDPKVLDIVDIPLLSHSPNAHQPENWLLDPDTYWQPAGNVTWNELGSMADSPATLWSNDSSSYSGLHDRVQEATAGQFGTSLYLLRLEALNLRVYAPGANFNNPKRRVQVQFTYAGMSYHLWVTDPLVERTYLSKPDGEYAIGACFVTVSLGEPLEGFCYKLVATIITPTRAAKGVL
jgi:hypothetical protein